MSNKHDIFILGIETVKILKISEARAKIYPETASWKIWNICLENDIQSCVWTLLPKLSGCFLGIIDCKSPVSHSDMIATSLFS